MRATPGATAGGGAEAMAEGAMVWLIRPRSTAARDQVQALIGHGYDQDFSQLILQQAKASGIELKSENVNVGDGL